MDIRRTILLMIFSLSLLMLWSNWQARESKLAPLATKPPVSAVGATPTSLDKSGVATGTANTNTSAAPAAPVAATGATIAGAKELVTVKTDVLKLTFDLHGAELTQADLLNYPVTANSDIPTSLLQHRDGHIYIVQSGLVGAPGISNLPTYASNFKLASDSLEMKGNTLKVSFVAEANGVTLTKAFTFHRGSYAIHVDHVIDNKTGADISPELFLQITRDGLPASQQSTSASWLPGWLGGVSSGPASFIGPAIYTDEHKYQKFTFSEIEKSKEKNKPIKHTANDGWFALIQHYFLTAWVPTEGVTRHVAVVEHDKNLFSVNSIQSTGLISAGKAVSVPATLWVGPQDQNALEAIAPGLDQVVDYGMLSIIAKPVFSLLTWIHKVIGNWGWSIIALTVLIKAAFYPLSAASYRSMAKMKQVSPRLQALKEKFGDDRQKLNTAMMEMYRTEKINPLGGCVPIVIQIPVFLSLYNVLLNSVELRGAPWIFWVQDLAVQDPYFILPAIMMGTMFLQMRLNPKPPDPVQAKVMMFMPLVFGGMMFFFPAGLVLYWCINNTLSIAQQWYITRKLTVAANDPAK